MVVLSGESCPGKHDEAIVCPWRAPGVWHHVIMWGNQTAEGAGAGEESIFLLGGKGVGDDCDWACDKIKAEALYGHLYMPKKETDGEKAILSACLY